MNFNVEQLYGFLGVPVVVGLTQVVKTAFPTADERFWPLVALLFGVGWNLGVGAVLQLPVGNSAILGVVVGLGASGLYSQVKTIIRPPLPPRG